MLTVHYINILENLISHVELIARPVSRCRRLTYVLLVFIFNVVPSFDYGLTDRNADYGVNTGNEKILRLQIW